MTRVCTSHFSSASCKASELMTVANMPIWSAETRSIMRACSATPRKKLPPPTTMATSTPRSRTARISNEISCSLATSTPKPRSAASASPDSLSRTLLYIQGKVSHIHDEPLSLGWGAICDRFRDKFKLVDQLPRLVHTSFDGMERAWLQEKKVRGPGDSRPSLYSSGGRCYS